MWGLDSTILWSSSRSGWTRGWWARYRRNACKWWSIMRKKWAQRFKVFRQLRPWQELVGDLVWPFANIQRANFYWCGDISGSLSEHWEEWGDACASPNEHLETVSGEIWDRLWIKSHPWLCSLLEGEHSGWSTQLKTLTNLRIFSSIDTPEIQKEWFQSLDSKQKKACSAHRPPPPRWWKFTT